MTDQAQTTAPVPASEGITETLAIIDALGVVVPDGVQIVADGKLSSKDLAPVVDAVKNYEVVAKAIANAKDLIKEAKDYDMSELAQIGAATLALIKRTKLAYEAGK